MSHCGRVLSVSVPTLFVKSLVDSVGPIDTVNTAGSVDSTDVADVFLFFVSFF